MSASEDLVTTPAFIIDQNHYLWEYSDSGMHRACFLEWPYRKEFREQFNLNAKTMYENPDIKRRMTKDGSIVEV